MHSVLLALFFSQPAPRTTEAVGSLRQVALHVSEIQRS